jgi:hypothetical protein
MPVAFTRSSTPHPCPRKKESKSRPITFLLIRFKTAKRQHAFDRRDGWQHGVYDWLSQVQIFDVFTDSFKETLMLRHLRIGLVMVVAATMIGNLLGKEPEQGHRLSAFFGKKNAEPGLSLLMTETVRSEIKLTDAQTEKITSLQKEIHEIGIKSFGLTPEERVKKTAETNIKIAKNLEALLRAEQVDRLLEILVQMTGPMILAETDVGKTIELTEDQKKQIKVIEGEFTETTQKMPPPPPPANQAEFKPQRREGFKKLQPILKEANEKIQRILTPEQQQEFNRMKGKEIDTARLYDELADQEVNAAFRLLRPSAAYRRERMPIPTQPRLPGNGSQTF